MAEVEHVHVGEHLLEVFLDQTKTNRIQQELVYFFLLCLYLTLIFDRLWKEVVGNHFGPKLLELLPVFKPECFVVNHHLFSEDQRLYLRLCEFFRLEIWLLVEEGRFKLEASNLWFLGNWGRLSVSRHNDREDFIVHYRHNPNLFKYIGMALFEIVDGRPLQWSNSECSHNSLAVKRQ